MREFRNNGHNVFIVNPCERRKKTKSTIIHEEGTAILKVKTLNIQKTNFIEKGLATILLEKQFLKAIQKNFAHIKFDLILYSTPPITFSRLIRYIKEKDKAISYLLLKDIFPQNAVDIALIKNKGLLHKYFRKKEKELYKISDLIGCMSPANAKYLLKHNPDIPGNKVEVCPNSIEPTGVFISENEKTVIRNKYSIPLQAAVYIYGGNLGKPQGLNFLLTVLESNLKRNDLYFFIAGTGTEYKKLAAWFSLHKPTNAQLRQYIPKEDYDKIVQSSDVGLIMLDKRFTIPNYPSRLLSYLENKKPVLAATDINTDIGRIAEENGYGLSCENGDINTMQKHIDLLAKDKTLRQQMGEKGHHYLLENYTVQKSYKTIMSHINLFN
jgi:glycosyltransferase involved in cell wall biosynthesis